MNKFGVFVKKIYVAVVAFCAAAILAFLVFIAMVSTEYMGPDVYEITYFLKDKVWLNILAVVILTGIVVFLLKSKKAVSFAEKINGDTDCFKKYQRIFLIILGAEALFWVITNQMVPGADQLYVQRGAFSFDWKDYTMLRNLQYLDKYHNQLGLVWLSYGLGKIFGYNNYFVFELLNAAGIVWIYYSLSRIMKHFGFKNTSRLLVYICGIFFYPLILYTSFVYGNVLGLSFSLAAVYRLFKYFSYGKKKDFVFSFLLISLGVLIKNNYLIFMVAMLIFAVYKSIQLKKLKALLFPLALVVIYILISVLPVAMARKVSGEALDGGASSLSWVVMGLQEGKKASGWYNGYLEYSYYLAGGDTKLQAEASKEEIRKSIQGFKDNKYYCITFFTKKLASEWNNPTFQAYWVNQIRENKVKAPGWLYEFLSIDGENRGVAFLNIYEFLILLGALFYLAFARKEEGFEDSLLLFMIFVGGFVFHMLWEGKGQYTISYVVLMIPFAISGFILFAKGACALYENLGKRNSAAVLKSGTFITNTAFFLLTVICMVVLFSKERITVLYGDEESYGQYCETVDFDRVIPDGIYNLGTQDGMYLSYRTNEDGSTSLLLSENPEECMAEIVYRLGKYHIRFTETYRCLYSEMIGNYWNLTALDSICSEKEEWLLIPDGSGFRIINGYEYALAHYDDGTITLVDPLTADESSIVWFIQ